MIGLGNVDVRESIWARQYWKGADGDGDRKLSLEEVERLCWRLNARFSRPELEKMFKVSISRTVIARRFTMMNLKGR